MERERRLPPRHAAHPQALSVRGPPPGTLRHAPELSGHHHCFSAQTGYTSSERRAGGASLPPQEASLPLLLLRMLRGDTPHSPAVKRAFSDFPDSLSSAAFGQ